MKIDDNYTIESDKYCWVLKYKSEGEINPNTGKKILSTNETYHPTIKAALKKYMDSKLKDSDTVENVLERLNEVEQIINKINK